MSLDGKVALVTGSSSGIGEAVARALADAGARVAINSSTSVEAGQAVAADLPGSIYVQADVADDTQARRMVDTTVAELGRLDILVNNAGTTRLIPHHDLEAVTAEDWTRILGVNIVGTWSVTRAAVPALRATGAGCVINVTSLAGLRPAGSSIPYAVSKAGLNHMTVLLANVLAPEIRVNAVAPGLVETPWTADWHDMHEFVKATAPLRRSGRPSDMAEACMFLAVNTYTTGQVILVDGGVHLR